MRILGLAAVILGGVVLAGCGGDDGPGTVTRLGTPPVEADPVGSATVEMAAGVVDFVVTNDGGEPHELVVIRSDVGTSELGTVDGVVPEADVDFRGEVEEFPAGAIRVGTFRLEAGRYLLICNIPQHYEQGMVAEFVVR